ncbi:hypothetical protein AX17_004624 [Amanita inopinata Kibby_2008]|nr:hypothetical protein AX17_004624 [Amanita inopinata Kibby_2008]
MDDSDDYIVDDITLDDETLAVLDREEQKYLSHNSHQNTPTDAPPVLKKRKTDSGWKPGPSNRFNCVDDFEDLPEISVQDDGTYGVHDITRNSSNTLAFISRPKSIEGSSDVLPRVKVSQQQTRLVATSNHDTGQQRQIPVEGRVINPSTAATQRFPSLFAGESDQHQGNHLGTQLQRLQRKLQELNEENQKIQVALKDAMDQKLMKEGEVSILRRGIEKTAQNHAVQMAAIKAAKEEADAKQHQMQKDMKEEIERIKTQFVFKQHEIESSVRRLPSSARANRHGRDFLTTPVRRSSQIPQLATDTPRRSRLFSEQVQLVEMDNETPRANRVKKAPRKPSRPGTLPGFQNAFVPSSSSPTRLRKDVFDQQRPLPPSSPVVQSPPSSPTKHISRNDSSETGHTCPVNLTEDYHAMTENGDDFMMVDEGNVEEVEDLGIVQPVNWTNELSRIILAHALPNSSQLTLQLLLGTSVLGDKYATAGSSILEVLASSSTLQDYASAARSICDLLVIMLSILNESLLNHHLESLLNLLTILVLSLPDFDSYLLCPSDESTGYSCLAIIGKIITSHLSPANKSNPYDGLAKEIITLLETLCFHAPADIMTRLSPLARNGRALTVLLDSGQPSWLLIQTCRLLILYGSHSVLAQELLISPSSCGVGEGVESGRMTLIDRLCALLYETDDCFDEFQVMREYILAVFAAISVSHADSLTALMNNDIFIPSLVYFLSNLTAPLWEEDERLRRAPQNIATKPNGDSNASPNFQHKTVATSETTTSSQYAPYVYPPEWIEKPERHDLELLSGESTQPAASDLLTIFLPADVARELLDLVVDGPESDSIWSMYGEDEYKSENETDEGEMEARLLGD